MFPYRHISILMMPTNYCNMNCLYCFNENRTIQNTSKMNLEVLEHICRITFPYYDDVKFIWHGAEPLSVGIEYYRDVLAIQNRYRTPNLQLRNSVQTNLTLIDEEFAQFLVQNNIHVGSSFDGLNNDLTRGNTQKILKGHEILKRAGGYNGFIYVVQSRNIDHLLEDYEWFKKQGISYTLNLYLQTKDDVYKLSVASELFIEKVCELFDVWLYDSECSIGISFLEDFVEYFVLNHKRLCCYQSCLGKHIGVQYDGELYCCNRSFPKKFNFGNVFDYQDIRECFNSEGFNNMLREATARRRNCKTECSIYDFCVGGCNSVALGSGSLSKCNQLFCSSLRGVYFHIYEKLTPFLRNEKSTIGLNPIVQKIFSMRS